MTRRLATCACGQLRAEVQSEPLRVSVCHCLDCQRRTGSVFGAQARFPAAAVDLQGQWREWSRVGDAGSRADFFFCPQCGSTVGWRFAGQADQIALAVGAFADPQFPAPTVSVYEERMHGWVGLPAAMEHID